NVDKSRVRLRVGSGGSRLMPTVRRTAITELIYNPRGGEAVRIPLDEALLGTRACGVDVEALDDALAALDKIDPRKSRVVELRYFGGLSVEETAEVLQVSPETVSRDWRMAKTWLFRELSKRSES